MINLPSGVNKNELIDDLRIFSWEASEIMLYYAQILKDSNYTINADLVIKSLGFDPEDLPNLFNEERLKVTKWGTIKTDFDTMQTSVEGVFAAGDIVRGASLVVWAIKDGRDVSEQIIKFINSKREKKVA